MIGTQFLRGLEVMIEMIETVLYIDDERIPSDKELLRKDVVFVIARTEWQAIAFIERYGIPNEIRFDHDLGDGGESINVVNWMIDSVLNNELSFPIKFEYSVHSQNPVGAENIKGKMNGILRHLEESK